MAHAKCASRSPRRRAWGTLVECRAFATTGCLPSVTTGWGISSRARWRGLAGWLDRDPAELAALTDDDLLALPSVGPVALARFRGVYGGGSPGHRPAPAQRRASRPGPGLPCGCARGLLELGHDQLGHRLSHLLARAGLFSADASTVARMSDDELLNLRGFGSVGLRPGP
jgi:hypothetical protein